MDNVVEIVNIDGIEFSVIDNLNRNFICWNVIEDIKPCVAVSVQTWEDEEERNKFIQWAIEQDRIRKIEE